MKQERHDMISSISSISSNPSIHFLVPPSPPGCHQDARSLNKKCGTAFEVPKEFVKTLVLALSSTCACFRSRSASSGRSSRTSSCSCGREARYCGRSLRSITGIYRKEVSTCFASTISTARLTLLRLALIDSESGSTICSIRARIELDVTSSLRRSSEIDKGVAVHQERTSSIAGEGDGIGGGSEVSCEGLQVVCRDTTDWAGGQGVGADGESED